MARPLRMRAEDDASDGLEHTRQTIYTGCKSNIIVEQGQHATQYRRLEDATFIALSTAISFRSVAYRQRGC